MIKLQIIPEREVSLQVLEPVVKPVIAPKRITENGSYFAKAEGVSGFDPVEVDVDLTPAYEAGRQAEYDRFWDAYQDNGKRNQYVYAFAQVGWTDSTYAPKYPIVGYSYGLQQVFTNASKITDTKVPLILQNGSMRATFNYCESLKRIPLLILEVPVTDLASAFSNCISLEEINIVCVSEGCIAANISLNASSNLSSDAVQSVTDALKDLTGETALTLTLHKDVGEKLTEEQKAAITAKNWILVY